MHRCIGRAKPIPPGSTKNMCGNIVVKLQHINSDDDRTVLTEAGNPPPMARNDSFATGQNRLRFAHRVVHVGLGPYGVMLVVDHLRPAQHMQVAHHILLHIRQGGDLREVPCPEKQHS